GYAGGDETKMLQRHLLGRPVRIGVGANRAATASSFFEKYGYVDPSTVSERLWVGAKGPSHFGSEEIGVAILDDGMQHWSLQRDIEIVMVNGVTLWGNCHLLPLGPLREPLIALKRADVVVIHHADLLSEKKLKDIELMVRDVKESLPIFFTTMAPSHFSDVRNFNSNKPLEALCNTIVLCVSAIGSANAFVQGIKKLGAVYVDQLEFSDHHMFQLTDYDRDPDILKHLNPFEVLVLCSQLKIISRKGITEDGFRKLLKEMLTDIPVSTLIADFIK
ncbi:hypothetical protein G4B88_024292, partial [Cannabis sativa]